MLRLQAFMCIFVSLAMLLNVSEATTTIMMIEPSTSIPDFTTRTGALTTTTGSTAKTVSSTSTTGAVTSTSSLSHRRASSPPALEMLSVTDSVEIQLSSTSAIVNPMQSESGSQDSQTFATVNPTSTITSQTPTSAQPPTTSVDSTSTTTTTAAANTISPTKSTTAMASSSMMKPMPKVSYQKCLKSDNDCKNNGDCLNGLDKICVCKGNFYGAKCEKEGNPIFKPLVYALGGTCGFLLLVICISLICSCKNSKRYKTSDDLDSFNNIGLRAKGTVNESYGDS